ncbi:hypothetical protein JTB14_030054, partial [Gonioctena quinquepunctata]
SNKDKCEQSDHSENQTRLGSLRTFNVENYDTRISCNIAISNDELYEQLQAFWKIEEVITKNHYTLEELECEEHYAKTFRRDDQGRFEVTLPVKDELNQLGESEKPRSPDFPRLKNDSYATQNTKGQQTFVGTLDLGRGGGGAPVFSSGRKIPKLAKINPEVSRLVAGPATVCR